MKKPCTLNLSIETHKLPMPRCLNCQLYLKQSLEVSFYAFLGVDILDIALILHQHQFFSDRYHILHGLADLLRAHSHDTAIL